MGLRADGFGLSGVQDFRVSSSRFCFGFVFDASVCQIWRSSFRVPSVRLMLRQLQDAARAVSVIQSNKRKKCIGWQRWRGGFLCTQTWQEVSGEAWAYSVSTILRGGNAEAGDEVESVFSRGTLPEGEGSACQFSEAAPRQSVSDLSLPLLPAVRFQGPGSVDPQINAWQVDALLFDVKRRRLNKPRQPCPFSLKQPTGMSASEFLDRSRPSIGISDVLNPPLGRHHSQPSSQKLETGAEPPKDSTEPASNFAKSAKTSSKGGISRKPRRPQKNISFRDEVNKLSPLTMTLHA